jgi:uncharacterized membrane protein YphA (DoxX/SURF4 family)
MPSQNFKNMPLRPWIAPALGAGLLLAGVAMALGMATVYGPMVAAAVALVILLIGHWRTTRADAARARKPVN